MNIYNKNRESARISAQDIERNYKLAEILKKGDLDLLAFDEYKDIRDWKRRIGAVGNAPPCLFGNRNKYLLIVAQKCEAGRKY